LRASLYALSNPVELSKLSLAIVRGRRSAVAELSTEREELKYPEGRVLYRLHRQRERNSLVVAKKKQQALEAGSLACEVCNFNFFGVYGAIGDGYIECHHTTPIAEYDCNRKNRLQDLALVCANCHRMLHRRRPWLGVDELQCVLWRLS
jgi:5-methylcytosine-specific restriction protein A